MRQEVAASKYGMALDHSLFVEYWKFKRGEGYNHPLVNKILSYYHNEFITNVGQFEHNNVQIDKRLQNVLEKNGLKRQNLLELSAMTTYKIILTEDRTNFPFVNIDEGKFSPALSNFYEGETERNAAREYMKNICQGAKRSILLYDRYINSVDDLDNLLNYILPNTKIRFISTINDEHKSVLKNTHDRLIIEGLGGTQPHHDRYLIIDDSIEVVLTSGFEYLQSQKRELSLVIRPLKSMHGLR